MDLELIVIGMTAVVVPCAPLCGTRTRRVLLIAWQLSFNWLRHEQLLVLLGHAGRMDIRLNFSLSLSLRGHKILWPKGNHPEWAPSTCVGLTSRKCKIEVPPT